MQQRQNPRVDFEGVATVEGPGRSFSGELRNISLGGALFVSCEPLGLTTGTGVEVAFRLPAGLSIRTPATLRWTRTDGTTSEVHVGLEFRALSSTNRAYLESYVESRSAIPSDELAIGARVVTKYTVAWDGAGRLSVQLSGLLCRSEAQELARLVREAVDEAKVNALRFQLDVRRLSVCSQEVVAELRRCFEALQAKGDAFGLLVGERSLAHTQVMRSIRETGLADSVFCADDPAQATAIWQQLEG